MLGSLAFSLTHRLRRSRALREYRQIAGEPWLPPEVVRARQLERLRALLAHAERTVPYYRELFKTIGARSDDIRSFDDFAQFPILTKDILRERQEDLVSEAVDRSTLTVQHSGGSTGVPVKFYRAPSYLDASDAGTYRNLAQCGWKPGDMVAFFWGFNERLDAMASWEFELRQRLRRFYQLDPFKSGENELAAWAARWSSIAPRVALGYASTMGRFAEFLLRTDTRVAPLKGAFTTAEKLYPAQREAIEKAFGCKVHDLYGSSEVQNIAAECPNGMMHVNADYCVLEVQESTEPGPHPLLATSLKQWAMPFIRYRNEDSGALDAGVCDCGRGFPLMRLDVARLSDNFVFPDGQVVHGEFFTHLMYGSEGIGSFQFHQTRADHVIMQIVSAPGAPGRRREAISNAVEQIQRLSNGLVTVEVLEVDSIPLSAAGKHRFTLSDVKI